MLGWWGVGRRNPSTWLRYRRAKGGERRNPSTRFRSIGFGSLLDGVIAGEKRNPSTELRKD